MNKLLLITAVIATTKCYSQSGGLDSSFQSGANQAVNCLVTQSDGKILVGGDFTSYGGVARSNIARINPDGTLDHTFNPGSGMANPLSGSGPTMVSDILLQPDGKVIACGGFMEYDGVSCMHIMRINSDGTIDPSFQPITLDGGHYIWSAALQADGKIIIVGHFTEINGNPRNRVARLNSDGSLDEGFSPVSGANSIVTSVAVQNDGKILIGGHFSMVNGVFRGRVARLNSDGTLDQSFNPGTGADGAVHAFLVQDDSKVLIGGGFTTYDGSTASHLIRVNENGTKDVSFDTGSGPNGQVLCISRRQDDRIMIGGQFTEYDGSPSWRIALISAEGTLDNGFISYPGASDAVRAVLEQSDGKVIIGGAFNQYGGTQNAYLARLFACDQPQPGNIFSPGGTFYCPSANATFICGGDGGAESIDWSLPSGWTGFSTTNAMSAVAGNQGGLVSVRGYSAQCGFSLPTSIEVYGAIPSICLVTVDSTSEYNILSWEKPETTEIDSFIVYREMTTNNFQRIGAVAYSEESVFRDFDANPGITSYRYRLSTRSCEQEWTGSLFHSTIHLQSLGNGNLLWTHYAIEGQLNPVQFYRVYRDDLGNGNFLPISNTVPGGNNSYTDVNFNSFPNAQYVVDVAWDVACDFGRNITTTRSNILGTPSSVSRIETVLFDLFPNPANTSVTLVLPDHLSPQPMSILNALGQEVLHGTATAGHNEVALDGLAKGVYAVRVGNGARRLVVE